MLLGQQVLIGLGGVLVFWLVVLSIWFFRISNHYKKLVGNTKREDLKEILENLLSQQSEVREKLIDTLGEIEVANKKSLANIQKIGIVKFNPYREAGGNHSFALCLLNGHDNGFIILSLHGREGSRLYLKEVKQGKAQYELSKEEQQSLLSAKRDIIK